MIYVTITVLEVRVYKLTAIEKNNYLISVLIIVGIFFASCSDHKQPSPVQERKKVEKHIEQNITIEPPLTPIQRCKKEKGKYNLIVDAPFGSIVRIMNIIPKYKDCIALKKGRYHIEVVNDGFRQYDKWIYLDSDTNMQVNLEKLQEVDRSDIEQEELDKAGYNLKKLQRFVKRHPNSLMAHTAKKRIQRIKGSFKNYSPKYLIKSDGCTGFYPKRLVEKMLNIETNIDYWRSIKWSGSCKNGLMFGRGVLYFDSNVGLHVELKGKMKEGFFQGKVYNSSSSKKRPQYIKKSGNGNFTVKLDEKFDYIMYQK